MPRRRWEAGAKADPTFGEKKARASPFVIEETNRRETGLNGGESARYVCVYPEKWLKSQSRWARSFSFCPECDLG
jgi:hypothetical protein